MTSNLEKIFMNWVFKNPHYFSLVEPFYFENTDIKFIYSAVKKEYTKSKDKEVPSTPEIINLVKLDDKENKISSDVIKAVLKVDFSKYRREFIEPRFEAWVKSNAAIAGLLQNIEQIKGIDKTDSEQVSKMVSEIRETTDTSTSVSLNTRDIGIDFDDPDAHNQETHLNKITTGFETLDGIMQGGFDRKTLNVFLGGTGSGKSLHLQNYAVNTVNAGYNVLYVTLELSDKKCLKRIGSMRLSIPINEYDEISKDREYMKSLIDQVNSQNTSGGVFENKAGKLFIKEYPSGSANINDIESHLKLIKETTGIEIDVLVIDYIQIMGCVKGVDSNMLYLKGKHLAEGLRAIAQKFNLACLTATQISKDKYEANDLTLADMPESKAIADTADTVWGIIRTRPMRKEGKYHLMWLKLRDCEAEYDRVSFDLNKKTLKLYNDHYLENIGTATAA